MACKGTLFGSRQMYTSIDVNDGIAEVRDGLANDTAHTKLISPTAADSKSTGFLALPPELRNMIYEYAVIADGSFYVPPADQGKTEVPSLCHVSRQLRNEFVPIFCSQIMVQADVLNYDFRRLTSLKATLFSEFPQLLMSNRCEVRVFVPKWTGFQTRRPFLYDWLEACATGGRTGRVIL